MIDLQEQQSKTNMINAISLIVLFCFVTYFHQWDTFVLAYLAYYSLNIIAIYTLNPILIFVQLILTIGFGINYLTYVIDVILTLIYIPFNECNYLFVIICGSIYFLGLVTYCLNIKYFVQILEYIQKKNQIYDQNTINNQPQLSQQTNLPKFNDESSGSDIDDIELQYLQLLEKK
ncbi:hypothetical protein ABPG74_022514 [Tetrahymena malaccensis]